MYQFYENTLTIPARALYEDLEVMSKSNYDKLCRLGKINRVRQGKGLDNHALVDFESLPERFRVEIVKKKGYPPRKTAQNIILNHYKDDYEAVDFYATYKLDDFTFLKPEKQDEYVKNAQMLWALDAYIKDMKSYRRSRGGSITKIWQEAAQACKEVKDYIGHTLPGTDRRLREKLSEFLEQGYIVLVSEKFGNKNSVAVKDNQQEAVLRELFRKWQGFDNVQIADQYNPVAKALGWATLSPNSVGNYRKKWSTNTISFSKGIKEFDNKIKMQIKRKAPEFAMAYWTLDGWVAELLYQDFDGVTTYHHHLTIVVVLDASCKYPVGYAIGEQECPELIKAALRNAVNHTEELFGFKHQVYQVQADNYSTKVMTPIYRGVAKNYIPTKVGNAKAKVIEPWFAFFNEKYCKPQSNWSGYGVKSKKQPNPDWLQKNKKNFPTKKQAYQQLEALIEQARLDVRDKYLETYAKSPDDLKTELSYNDYILNLGVKKSKTTKHRGEGIEFRVNNIKYSYESFQLEFRNHLHLDWTIFFDPQNMEKVLAYNEESALSFELEEKYIQPMDIYSQEREDRDEMGRVRKFNRQLEAHVLETRADDVNEILNLVSSQNKLNDTLKKILITDSVGQHKDQLNKQMAATAEKTKEKQERKVKSQELKDQIVNEDEYYKNKINTNKYLDNE